MKRVLTNLLIIIAVSLPISGGWAQGDPCRDGVKVGYGEGSDGRAIEIRLHLNEGMIEKIEILGGCDPVFVEGAGTVSNCTFIFNPIDGNLDLTFMGVIDGEEFFVDELPFIEVCGTTFGGAVNPGPSPNPPGSGGTELGGDDDDDDDGSGGSSGNGERVVGQRVPISNIRPIAQLIGVEVEVNPPTIDMRRVASGVADVSFTARLVWSNDNLPANFEHDPTNWNFLGRNDNGDWDGWETESDWGSSMWNQFRMEVDPDRSPTAANLKKGDHLTWNFKLNRSNLEKENIRTRKVPVRAVYRAIDGDPDSEIDAVVNLRIENQAAVNPLATSSGPAARNVTYRRILE